MGIEPTYPAWKAGVLPLNYTRMYNILLCQLIDRWYIITFILWCQHFFYNKCPVPESNQRHEDFQSSALPTELTGQLTYSFYLTFSSLSRYSSPIYTLQHLISYCSHAPFAKELACERYFLNLVQEGKRLLMWFLQTHVRMTVDQFSSLERA